MTSACFRPILSVCVTLLVVALVTAPASAFITLTEPIQPGDYIYWTSNDDFGSTSFFEDTMVHVRGSTILSKTDYRGTAGAGDAMAAFEHIGGDFAPNGDYYYLGGASAADNGPAGNTLSGNELWVIKAGQTTSTLLTDNLTLDDAVEPVGLSVKSDGTAYFVAQGYGLGANQPTALYGTYDNGSNLNPQVVPITSPAGKGIVNPAFADSLDFTADENFLLHTSNRGAEMDANEVDVIDTLSTSPTFNQLVIQNNPVAGDGTALGPLHRPMDFAIDYTHPADQDGNLRLLVTNTNLGFTNFAGEGIPAGLYHAVTELRFNPTTGQITNPFVGTGNIFTTGTGNALIINAIQSNVPSHEMDRIMFDSEGNLLVTARFEHPRTTRAFSQAELDAVGTGVPIRYEDDSEETGVGTTIWDLSGHPSGNTPFAVDDVDLAPGGSVIPDLTAGDFDEDGDVDGNDFLVWQRNPSVGNLADWQTNYGTPLSATVGAIPEPTTATSFLLGLAVLGLFRRQEWDN